MPHPADFSIPTHPQPQVISLFAGVGGLDLGMEAAGLKIALAVEKDPYTAAQYRQNFPNTPVLCADIAQLSTCIDWTTRVNAPPSEPEQQALREDTQRHAPSTQNSPESSQYEKQPDYPHSPTGFNFIPPNGEDTDK